MEEEIKSHYTMFGKTKNIKNENRNSNKNRKIKRLDNS